jgi:hypothetical protein
MTGATKPGTNGGFQFRSRLLPNADVAGYQVDHEFGHDWKVRLYDEHGRHTLALQGKRTEIDAQGRMHTTDLVGPAALPPFQLERWHEYHLIARGPRLLLNVDGKPVAEVIDGDPKQQDASGILALQLHTLQPQNEPAADSPFRTQFKDIRLKRLAAGH